MTENFTAFEGQRRLAAEFGKTEVEVLRLRAAERGLGEALEPALQQLQALKDANAKGKLANPISYKEATTALLYLGTVFKEAMRIHSSVGLLM